MSHVKNIKGNKESQKTKTPQTSIDPELGLNPLPEPEPEPEPGHDDDINVMFSEKEKRDDEIISAGNEANERVKNMINPFSNKGLTRDKEEALEQAENNRDDRQNNVSEKRKAESPQFDEKYPDSQVSHGIEGVIDKDYVDDNTTNSPPQPEPSVISESFSEQELYDKHIYDNHLSEINTHLSDINNKFMRGRNKNKRVLKLRKIEKKSKFIYDNFKVLKKINKESSTNIVIDLKNELNELKDYLSGKTNFENKKNLNDFHTKIDHLYDKFKGKNIDQIEDIKNNDLKMNIKHEREFDGHLEKKLTFLTERLDLLQMKYNGYKQWYDRMNITIIIISTVLSVFESFRLEVDDLIPENNHGLRLFFNMTPIAISSTITCSAAIIKFKKYQEKMENMQFTREKVITAISRIEHVKESLWFNECDDDFHDIKQKYLSEVFTTYNESISELKRHVKFNDPHKFDKRVSDNNKENYKNKNMYI